MKKSLLKLAKVICVSEYVNQRIKTKAPELNNLVTVHNFIDFDGEIKPALASVPKYEVRTNLGLPNNAKVITYFGRINASKGVDLLLPSFAKLLNQGAKNVFLLIGGTGPDREMLESMAKSIGNIFFLGEMPRNLQLATIAQSNIFVHPARYPDACPTTLIEAAALGVPIITTNAGGAPELIADKQGGFLVAPDSSQMADKIDSLLADEYTQQDFRSFNLEWSHRFDITSLGPKLLNLYYGATG